MNVIDILNVLLAQERQAIRTYRAFAEYAQNAGFKKFAKYVRGMADDETEHERKLMKRIRFLDGVPDTTDTLDVPPIGNFVQFLNSAFALETTANDSYNEAIHVCFDARDDDTEHRLRHILGDERKHFGWVKEQLSRIQILGLELYLSKQQ